MAAGILTVPVQEYNGKTYTGNKVININQLVMAFAKSATDTTVIVWTANDESVNLNEYVLTGAYTLASLKTAIDAVDAENVATIPSVNVKEIRQGGGSMEFPLLTFPTGKPYLLNQQFYLDVSETLDSDDAVLYRTIQYRKNYNDYFAEITVYGDVYSGNDWDDDEVII